jgi:hypothetical protein
LRITAVRVNDDAITATLADGRIISILNLPGSTRCLAVF